MPISGSIEPYPEIGPVYEDPPISITHMDDVMSDSFNIVDPPVIVDNTTIQSALIIVTLAAALYYVFSERRVLE